MKSKTTTVLYWMFTGLFAAFMLPAGVNEFLHGPGSEEVMRHLGFPFYTLEILGAGKVLGALALVQPRFRALKEWAYAGFAFNLLGAVVARAAAHDGAALTVSPLLFLGWMLVSYALWKRRSQPQPADAAPMVLQLQPA